MSLAATLALVFLALFVGALALLGLIVLVRVFISAQEMKARFGNLPAQMEARAQQLAQWEQGLSNANAELIRERNALEASKAPVHATTRAAEPEPTNVFDLDDDSDDDSIERAILEATKAEQAKIG